MKKLILILSLASIALLSGCSSMRERLELEIQNYEGEDLHVSITTMKGSASIDEKNATNDWDAGIRTIESVEIKITSAHTSNGVTIIGKGVKRKLIPENDTK